MAAKLTLSGFRNETWNPTIEYAYSGPSIPLDGATARLQWRLYPGAPGSPLVNLPNDGSLTFEDTAATEDEIAQKIAPPGGRILRIYPEIGPTKLKSLPSGLNQPEPGEPDEYAWDVIFKFADETAWMPMGGKILLAPGVTEV